MVNNSTEQIRRKPKVYITNRGCHDYSAAEIYGELVFMTDGIINRYAIGETYRVFENYLKSSHSEDYLLVSGMPIMLVVAAGILSAKHNCLNLLMYKDGKYLKRNITYNLTGESNESN